jgi:methyl-accepting chemotaxis protein
VEIQAIVSELQTKTTNAVHSIAESQKISHQSLQQCSSVASAFAGIGEVFHQLDNLTGDISHNIQFQQSSTETINNRASEVTRLNHDVDQILKTTAEKAQEQKNILVAVRRY